MSLAEVCTALKGEESSRFPDSPLKRFEYGTAGFREKADVLDKVVFRVGILAVLRSKVTKSTIGVVITASHNPVQDNGVKVVDPTGEMLDQTWEGLATTLANASSAELPRVLTDVVQETECDFSQASQVVFARDTRPSGERLVAVLKKSLEIMGAKTLDYGVLTTPQLHYMVRSINTGVGVPTELAYYQNLAAAFHTLVPKSLSGPVRVLKLDGANGVGAEKVRKMMEHIDKQILTVEIFNYGDGVLNEGCGADHVKAHQASPKGFSFTKGDRCLSFDGDADRIVYFYEDTDGKFRLLDGDKIASLAAAFIAEKLKKLKTDLSVGVVQTAYANGNSTAYLQEHLRVPVVCTSTGVKYLHHRAQDFDVGVYFESNGHGTVLFSQRAMETFQKAKEDSRLSVQAREAASQLHALTQLINQATGDSISDLLLVEVILINKAWGYAEWNATYTDLPNRQLKVKVQDRMVVKTVDHARRCTSPEGLQTEIDKLVNQTPRGRAFVRPSGTEDVVRVYAEAETQDAADTLAVQVATKLHEMAGGTGEPPSQDTLQ